MIGSDLSVKGGMTSVINMYKQAGLFDRNVEYLPSHITGTFLGRVAFYVKFLVTFLSKLFVDKQIGIVHVHSSYKGSFFRKAIIIWISFFLNKKTIFHLHGSEFNYFYNNAPCVIKRFISKTLNITTIIVVLSTQWKCDIKRICSNTRIHVIYNPLIIQEQNNFVNQETINVLFMGLISKRKGAYDIVEVFKEIKDYPVAINMYGNGDVEELINIVKEKHLEHVVKVNGWISGDKINKAYKAAHIYILPSYNEGLPMSILEAMSFGLPIISTNVGGIPDAVIDGSNGFLITPGDHKALAERLLQLSNDISLIKEMGQKSYDIAKAKFSVDLVIDSLEKLYVNI